MSSPWAAQVWKDKLFPLLKQHLAEQVDSVTSYLLLYHEAALANLLEVGGRRSSCQRVWKAPSNVTAALKAASYAEEHCVIQY